MGLGFSYFFNLVFLWVILSWEVAEFSCYSSVSLGRRKKNKTHTSCLIEPLKRAIKHWWHAPSVRHICLKTEAKWDWYLPKHLAGKELFALLDRESVPSMWRVRISYINAWDFSFHMWPNVLFFFFLFPVAVEVLYSYLWGTSLQKYYVVHFILGSDHQALIEGTFTQSSLITLNVLVLYFLRYIPSISFVWTFGTAGRTTAKKKKSTVSCFWTSVPGACDPKGDFRP